jgi:hypothetical protein
VAEAGATKEQARITVSEGSRGATILAAEAHVRLSSRGIRLRR